MSSEKPISRREAVTNVGAGLAGAAFSAAVPQANAQTSNTAQTSNGGPTVAPFVDPTSKYPKPP